MKEEVFYLKSEGCHGAPSTPPTEHYYLPKRDLEIINLAKIWQVRKLEAIPKDAILMEIDKEKIDNIMSAYQEHEKATKEFGKKSKVNPFEYWRRFNVTCESIFSLPIES